MAGTVTGLVGGGKARPGVERFVELVTELWEEELVAPRAVLSVGPVSGEHVVTGAAAVGKGREVRWKGTDLAGLLAALRASYGEDVAIWFERVDLDAFEPAEEEEYEDVPDEGDEDDGADDEPVAAAKPGAPAAKPADDDGGLGEFELVAPSLVLYSTRTPIELAEVGGKRPKNLGAHAAWATLDGEDMSLLVDDLGDCWLLDVLESGFGAAKVGKQVR